MNSYNVPSEEMSRHMKEIFEERDDPNWKERKRINQNRKELLETNTNDLGI